MTCDLGDFVAQTIKMILRAIRSGRFDLRLRPPILVVARAMATRKISEVYVCTDCGDDFAQSHGQCPACGAWNTLKPFRTSPATPAASSAGGGAGARAVAAAFPPAAAPSRARGWVEAASPAGRHVSPVPLSSVSEVDPSSAPLRSLLPGKLGAELCRVLGGGVVAGSLLLLGGEPGCGKSTLLLQVAALMAAASVPPRPVLYVTGEENVAQVAARGRRLGLGGAGVELLCETRLDVVLAAMGARPYAAVVVDSIQTVFLEEAAGSAGSVGQVRECAVALLRAAKAGTAPILITGHVTKGGDLAGPKALEHIVDVVLSMQAEAVRDLRTLRGTKNRYGAADELAVLTMAPDGLHPAPEAGASFLVASRQELPPGVAGAVGVTCVGARPLLFEVQALASMPPPSQSRDGDGGGPSDGRSGSGGGSFARRTGVGLSPQRLSLLLSVLAKRALGAPLLSADVLVCVAGGLELDDPASDLAGAPLEGHPLNDGALVLHPAACYAQLR